MIDEFNEDTENSDKNKIEHISIDNLKSAPANFEP